jgi:hypothetical protein
VTPDRDALQRMSRDELIAEARRCGALHPELMTRVELADEILRLSEDESPGVAAARGFFGAARDLLARVVERKLNLPQAAALIRGIPTPYLRSRAPAPVATVTLAEIYAAQGHPGRALSMLDEVLQREPDHEAARGLRDRLASARPAAHAGEPPGPAAAVVVVTDDGESVYVYWEIRRERLAELQTRLPGGQPTVRLLSFVPSLVGAQASERDIVADPAWGGAKIDLVAPDAVVRAVLGWSGQGAFRPLVADGIVSLSGETDESWALPVAGPVAERARLAYRQL